MRYDRTAYQEREGARWIRPEIFLNGTPYETTAWPVFSSPVVRLQNRILTVEADGKKLAVDWSEDYPVIPK